MISVNTAVNRFCAKTLRPWRSGDAVSMDLFNIFATRCAFVAAPTEARHPLTAAYRLADPASESTPPARKLRDRAALARVFAPSKR